MKIVREPKVQELDQRDLHISRVVMMVREPRVPEIVPRDLHNPGVEDLQGSSTLGMS